MPGSDVFVVPDTVTTLNDDVAPAPPPLPTIAIPPVSTTVARIATIFERARMNPPEWSQAATVTTAPWVPTIHALLNPTGGQQSEADNNRARVTDAVDVATDACLPSDV